MGSGEASVEAVPGASPEVVHCDVRVRSLQGGEFRTQIVFVLDRERRPSTGCLAKINSNDRIFLVFLLCQHAKPR